MKTSLGAQVFLAALFLQAIGDGFGQKRRTSQSSSSQVVDFDCPEEFGYYAHPGDCTQYYVCVFGGALLESCTGGLMYSHELQTCDWPRNVGCGEGAGESPATVVQSQPSRSRPSIPSRIQQQPREPQPVPKVITKHDLYTEEELGPAEEIETDRQQRVYRGQPPTIGQVASDRDAISTHSNAIPVPSGGRDKLSVVSYGPQQQYNRASVAPQQAYIEQVTSTPTRTYNASQYIAQQYDPYYNLYDEETDLYKDIDYSQYTTNQGSQGQRYRTPVTYKERKQPTVEIVQQEPVQRAPTYTKSKFNSQQDLYQPVVSQDEYESYSIQSNDDTQYNRQPVQTKTSNRLAPVRGTEGTPGSKEALPEGVERNDTLGTQRITFKSRFSHSTARPFPPSPSPSTTDTSQQTTRSSSNDIVQDSTSRPVKISESLPKAEKLIRSREPFVIQVSTPKTEANVEASRRATYELIKMFLDQGLQAESPRPFARNQKENDDLRESQISKGHFIVPTPSRNKFDNIDRSQNEPSNNDNEEASNQRSSNVLPQRIVERERSNFYRQPFSQKSQKENSPQVNRGKPQLVEDYSISSLPSRLSVDSDYYSYNSGAQAPVSQRRILPSRERTSSNAVDYTTTRRAPTTTSGTTSTSTTTEQIVRSTVRPEVTKEVLRKPLPPTSESIDTQRNTRRRIPSRGSQRNNNPFRIIVDVKDDKEAEITETKAYQDSSYNSDISKGDSYRNDYNNAKPTKVYLRPTSAPQSTYARKDSDTDPKTFESTTDSTTTSQPSVRPDNDKRSFDSFPPNVQCTSNCNDKQTIRVRPTTYDIQTTPGITRGNSRHRGSLTYTVSPNEAEPTSRGTPASARGRPTLKPSTAIVSKAAEFVDIYRFPPTRPDPVYPTPQADKTAAKCRKDVCLLPDCYCGGKDIPGDLPVEETPQIVLLTFDDSVNDLNKGLYSDLFEKGRTNPNGCPVSATFYVSHEWTDYSQVQNLYSGGHEIASHSVSHSFGEQFSQKKWTREIAGQREILAAYGGVKLEDIRGMRAPFLAVGGNKMFKMLHDSNFTYDSSMPVYENKPPSWPYTMDYKIFHDCMIPPCPSRSYPGVWEVPMVMWQDLNGGRCSMGDACSNPPTADGVYKMLIKNFERHFTSNRAPFGLFYHAAWFTQPHHKEGFIAFMDTIVNMPEVWLVTNWQAIQWVRDPTPISRLNNFAPFQCNYPDRPKKCNNPKVCNLWHKSGVRYMRTCQTCPEVYPWTGKTGVRNSRVDNEVFQE